VQLFVKPAYKNIFTDKLLVVVAHKAPGSDELHKVSENVLHYPIR
jgi:hypothetical protein